MSAPDGGPLFLGIDAGNTKTVAVLADAHGTVVGWGRDAGSNIYVDRRAALGALDRAVAGALARAACAPEAVQVATLSAAGADWPEDFTLLGAELASRGWGRRRQVVNDAVGALRAASSGPGVAVVCGTSAGIAARGERGQVWHSSYWQEPEGAEELGRLALRAVYRAELGIDPPTRLTARLLDHYHLPDVEALLHAFTARERPLDGPGPVGALARLLLDEAEAGDPTSARLVERHGQSLGDYVLAAARRVELQGRYPVTTSGGVMRHPSPRLAQAMIGRVREVNPAAWLQQGQHEPVYGALMLSYDLADLPFSEQHGLRLAATVPEPSFFYT